MTDPMHRMAAVREAMAEQRAKLPAVDHNGTPLAPPLTEQQNEYLAMVRDDETWQKIGPGWEQYKRYWEAKAASLPVSPIVPELDGTLTPEQRQLAAALMTGVMSTAQPAAESAPSTPRPDPSQGGSGGSGGGLDTHIEEVRRNGEWLKVVRLQNQKLNPGGNYGYGRS